MNATPFRYPFLVSPNRIAALSDAGLNTLMRMLFRHQAYIAGLKDNEYIVNTEDKAADEGCDGWTEKPNIPDTWLGNCKTCWQFKVGTAGQPAK